MKSNKKKITPAGALADKTDKELQREAEIEAAELAKQQAASGSAVPGQLGAPAVNPAALSVEEQQKQQKDKWISSPALTVLDEMGKVCAKLTRMAETLFERADTKDVVVKLAETSKVAVAKAGEGGFDVMTFPSLKRLAVLLEATQQALVAAAKEKLAAEEAQKAKDAEAAKAKATAAKAAHDALPADATFNPKPGDKDWADWAARNPQEAAKIVSGTNPAAPVPASDTFPLDGK